MVMEAEMSHDLQFEGLRTRRAGGDQSEMEDGRKPAGRVNPLPQPFFPVGPPRTG